MGCHNRSRQISSLTSWFTLFLVAVLTLGPATSSVRAPLKAGASSLTQRVKPRPRAVLKTARTTCPNAAKKCGVHDVAICCPTSLSLITVVVAVPTENPISCRCRTLPSRSDRAPPFLV